MMGALWESSVGYWSTDLSFRRFVEDVSIHYAGTHGNIPIFFKASKISNGADSQKSFPIQRASYLSKYIWEENESEQEEGNTG